MLSSFSYKKKKHDLDQLIIAKMSLNMQVCKVQISQSRLFIFCHPADETRSSGYLHPQIQYFWRYFRTSGRKCKRSHLTSMNWLHMRPDGQQQEEQGKQQISHLFLSDSGFDLFLSFLSLFYIFVCFLSLFNPLLFLDLIVFLLFPPPPPPLQ